MPHFLHPVTHLSPVLIYLVVAFVVGAEVASIAGFLIPCEATLLLTGLLAHAGLVRLPVALAVAGVAAPVGDSVGYLAGRRLGPRIRRTRLGRRIGVRRWQRTDALFTRYGGSAVLIGRWLPFVRTLMPRLAGMTGMRYRVFLAWNVPGAVGWPVATVLIGYAAAASTARAAALFDQVTGVVAGVVLAVVMLVAAAPRLIGHIAHRRRSGR